MKITDIDIIENNVKSAPDTLSVGDEKSARDIKNIFDKLPELIARKHNSLVDYATEELCKKSEVEATVVQKVIGIGADEIARIIYDSDKDGMVDNAKRLDGHDADYFAAYDSGIYEYVHTAGTLTGSGSNGRFKATVSETVSAINVNGVECAVVNGDENEIELKENCWYTFILDNTTVNFKAGGGLGNSKLALATATEADVLNGFTFYSGDKELKTGGYKASNNLVSGQLIGANGYRGLATMFSNSSIASNIGNLNGSYFGCTSTIASAGTYVIGMNASNTANSFKATMSIAGTTKQANTSNTHQYNSGEITLSKGDVIKVETNIGYSSSDIVTCGITIIKIK